MPDIILTIPPDKVERLKTGYFKMYPVPKDKDGVPLYSDLEWFKKTIREIVLRDCHRGMTMIYNESKPQKEEDLIEE